MYKYISSNFCANIFRREVIECYVNQELIVKEGKKQRIADMRKLDPIIYALDNCYYKIGEIIGVGYEECKNFKL
jgi:hypothetical protein